MNAKEEFLNLIIGMSVTCAKIEYGDIWNEEESFDNFILPCDYTDEQFKSFIDSLDFEYDSGYGCQQIFGTVWFANGEWASRGEYDGSEWWEIHSCPPIPFELIPSGL